MSKTTTAAQAVAGQRYKTPRGHAVTFQGPSKKKGLFSVVALDTGATVDLPGDHVLIEVDATAEEAKASVALVAGRPRDVLEPAIPRLTEAELDALADADTRAWVQQEILNELGRRRTAKAAAAAPPVVAPAAPPPVQEENAPPPFPTKASAIDTTPADPAQEARDERCATGEHDRPDPLSVCANCGEPPARISPPVPAPPYGPTAPTPAFPSREELARKAQAECDAINAGGRFTASFDAETFAISTREVVVGVGKAADPFVAPIAPAPTSDAVSSQGPSQGHDAPAAVEVEDGLHDTVEQAYQRGASHHAEGRDVHDRYYVTSPNAAALHAEWVRGWTDAQARSEEHVPEAGGRSSAYMAGRDAYANGAERTSNPYHNPETGVLQDEEAVEWDRGWVEAHDTLSDPFFARNAKAADTAGAAVAPPVEPAAETPAKAKRTRKAKAAPPSTTPPQVEAPPPAVVEAATEPEPVVRPFPPAATDDEVRAWLSTSLQMVRNGTGTVQEVEDGILNACETRPHLGVILGPVTVHLAGGDRSERLWEALENALRTALDTLPPIDRAADQRGLDEAFADAERAQRAEQDRDAGLDEGTTRAAEERRTAPTLPGRALTGGETERLAFLCDRLDTVDAATFDRFELLVGSVRENTTGMVGLAPEHADVVDAALAWETSHENRGTIVDRLGDKLARLRGGRGRAPTPTTAGRTEPRHAPVAASPTEARPLLSSTGLQRVAQVQEALAALSAAVPGYVAACEARDRLAVLGIPVDLVTLAGQPLPS